MRKEFYLIIILLSTVFSLYSQETEKEKFHLMPWPKEIKAGTGKLVIDENFTISINNQSERVYRAATQFIRRLSNSTGVFIEEGFPVKTNKEATVKVRFRKVADLNLKVEEAYTLEVNSKGITIESETDIGALHGLETLQQLVEFNRYKCFFYSVSIKDTPRFKWRGLMIDVARHFQPVAVLKRNLDAMASVKMNVFHWHLSDDQGFRVESKVYPKLHELGSDGQYYTQEEIKEVVRYADRLGIRVIPEIDVPGHATAILTAYPALGSKKGYDYQIERFAGVFDPTLDPTNSEVYVFLDNLFGEVASLFPDVYFHIGGDENEGKHWDANPEIQAFKKKHELKTNHDLQTYFNIKLEKILKKHGKKLVGWDEIMTPNMPKTAIIHSWRGEHEGFEQGTLIEAVKKGYQTILSNGYYIDRMQPVAEHYLIEPTNDVTLSAKEERLILGGEATMWSELVTPLTIDSRIWPRTAAIAERFWSPKNVRDVDYMHKRLQKISRQLEELGITHLKNQEAILRNLTKGQEISSLKALTKIYEPLKIYSRNKGGTEYKSFSPFTLFADACTTDAPDARIFNKAVNEFLKTSSVKSKERLVGLLEKWHYNYEAFLRLETNPLLEKLKPFYASLNTLSVAFIQRLKGNKLSKKEEAQLEESFEKLKEPMEDTELMILSSLHTLMKHLNLNEAK